MVFKRFVVFRFFIKFDRSELAIIFVFELPWSLLVFHQEWSEVRTCSFWTIKGHVRYPAPINPMNVRTLSTCCLLLLDVISIVSEMFVIFRIFVKFDRSGHAKFFTFWKITDREIYRSRTFSINPTNVIACWSSCDHFRRWYGWFPTDLKIFDFSSNLTGPDLYFLST